jgi:selenocysteine lyase/cysteine desulfurase
MNRDDFKILKKDVIYFDNGATTLKPKVVRDAILKYYDEYTANTHRGDYKLSATVDMKRLEKKLKTLLMLKNLLKLFLRMVPLMV